MELLHKLGVEPLVFVAQLVNVGLLFGLLTFLLYRPILDLLERRRQTIAGGLNDARVYHEKKAWLEHESARQRTEAEAEARRIKLAAQESAERILAEAAAHARDERVALLEDARTRIAEERRSALAGLEHDVSELTVRAAGRLLQHAWDPKLEEQFIGALLKDETAKIVTES